MLYEEQAVNGEEEVKKNIHDDWMRGYWKAFVESREDACLILDILFQDHSRYPFSAVKELLEKQALDAAEKYKASVENLDNFRSGYWNAYIEFREDFRLMLDVLYNDSIS